MAENLDTADREATEVEAVRALRAGDYSTARHLLMRLAESEPENIMRWIGLAAACRGSGALSEAIVALEHGLKSEPRHFMALLMKASMMDMLGATGAPEAYGIALAQMPDGIALDPPTQGAVRRAREVHERYTKGLRGHLHGSLRPFESQCNADEQRKLRLFCDDSLRLRKRYHQQPAQFYYPGLPALEIYGREHFPWLAALEAQTEAITQELLGVVDANFTGFVPYIDYAEHEPLDQWAGLNRNPDWGALHLIDHGQVVAANAARCPATMAALSALPQPHIPHRGPAAMFSALKPHTHIPPHTGVSNTRLVMHLPLIVPDNCGFRVGNETWQWQVGTGFVFDDTLEHEAWNRSDRVRIVLIADVWSPFLSESERQAITAVMSAVESFQDHSQ